MQLKICYLLWFGFGKGILKGRSSNLRREELRKV